MNAFLYFFIGGMLCGAICSYWTAYKHAVKGQYAKAYRRGWRTGYDHHLRIRHRNEKQRDHIRQERRKRNLPFVSLVGSESIQS